MSDDDFARTFGLRNDAILRMLLGPDVTAETVREVETGKEEDYRRQVRDLGLELLPGVRFWLDRLATGGWRQAVGSSAPRANLDLVLDVTDTRRYFAEVMAGADVHRGKPDPEVYLTAASRLDVPIGRCVVVEDAPEAVAGSVKAGIKTIGVGAGYQVPGISLGAQRMDGLPSDAFDRLVPPV